MSQCAVCGTTDLPLTFVAPALLRGDFYCPAHLGQPAPSPALAPTTDPLLALIEKYGETRMRLGDATALFAEIGTALTALRSSASALAEAERELSETTLLLQKVTAALNTALDDETQALFHYQAGYTAGYSHGRRQEPQRGEESARAFVAPRAALAPGHPTEGDNG